jgi:DNA processing protein
MGTERTPSPTTDIIAIPIEDGRYPPLLRHVSGAPDVLYIRGSLEALTRGIPVAVIGTRAVTRYGEAAAVSIAGPLARAGACVVSGLALGVDAVAHAAALDAGGTTVAVLASGVDDDCIGPRTNFGLARRILASGGAVVSEFPPGTPAAKHRFPLRNRIIAGLSQAVVVIEAAERSGALITAKLALDGGRDVYAVPGPIFSEASKGTNWLISQGATPLLVAKDLVDRLGLGAPSPEKRAEGIIGALLARLDAGPATVDELALVAKRPGREIAEALALLEIDGHVTRRAGLCIKN